MSELLFALIDVDLAQDHLGSAQLLVVFLHEDCRWITLDPDSNDVALERGLQSSAIGMASLGGVDRCTRDHVVEQNRLDGRAMSRTPLVEGCELTRIRDAGWGKSLPVMATHR